MTDPPATQFAICELLRAAELCLSSTNTAIRGVGVMLVTRASGLAEGKIDPELLSDLEIDRICDLLVAVTSKPTDFEVPDRGWADRLYLVK